MSLPAFRTRRSRAFLHRHDADSFHPLHVGLWRDHAYKFFGRDTESLCTLKLDKTSSSSLFVTVILVDSLEFITTEDRLQLLCSDQFLSRHGFVDAQVVFVRPVVTFPLSRLTLTIARFDDAGDDDDKNENDAALSWLRAVVASGDFRAALCVGGAASRRLVARRGDVLPLPARSPIFVNDPDFLPGFLSRIFVLDCTPIHQGQLAVDTKISVVAPDPSSSTTKMTRNLSPLRPMTQRRGRGGLDNVDVDQRFEDVSTFEPSSSSCSTVVLRPRVIKTEADLRRRLDLVKDDPVKTSHHPICDDLRVVFVHLAAARRLLGARAKPGRCNGWVLVCAQGEREGKVEKYATSTRKASQASRERYALGHLVVAPRGVGREEEKERDVAWISPSLMFNLNKSLSSGVSGARRFVRLEIATVEMIDPMISSGTTSSSSSSSSPSPSKLKASSSTVAPPYATEVHISAIATPATTSSQMGPQQRLFRQAFRQFFERPRIVCQGDTICIDVGADPDYFESPVARNNNNNNNLNNGHPDNYNRYLHKRPRMFYKVVKVKSRVDGVRFCLADSHHTSLIQAGIVNDPVPISMARWFPSGSEGGLDELMDEDDDDDKDDDRGPSSGYFSKYVRQLKKLISPVLDDDGDGDDESSKNSERRDGVARILISGSRGVGKSSLVERVATDCHLNFWAVDCLNFVADTLAATEAKLRTAFFKALDVVPCVLLLKGVHHLAKDPSGGGGGVDGGVGEPRVAAALKRIVASVAEARRSFPLILIGTTHDDTLVAPRVHDLFLHRVSVRPPSTRERKDLLERIFRKCGENQSECDGSSLNLTHVAQRTSGFLVGDLLALAAAARREACERVLQVFRSKTANDGVDNNNAENEVDSFHIWRLQEDLVAAGFGLTSGDVDGAVESLLLSRGGDGRFVDGDCGIPTTRWEDIGGFEGAKRKIRDTLSLPLTRPDLFTPRTSCSGILLHGPPGTGKTLFAKAVATELALNFVSIKGPELLNMYVGQSEANVRRVFRDARDASPCVIFFDELDALVPNRGFAGDAGGGVMDRVVSQMCAELDGLHLIDGDHRRLTEGDSSSSSEVEDAYSRAFDVDDAPGDSPPTVFVIGATNRPDLIDPALLRPGRMEKQIYLGPAEDPDDALAIFRAVTKDFHLHKSCSIEAVARMCPAGMTGAEIADLCSDALTKALERKVRYVERKRNADPEYRILEADTQVVVDESDFVHALSQNFGNAY